MERRDVIKYAAALVGGVFVPGRSMVDAVAAQAGWAGNADEIPVEQKPGIVRVVGIAQRRSGVTRAEAPFQDSPHIVPSYYALVYRQLLKKAPGREVASVLNYVTDSAFGGDRNPPPGPENLHIVVSSAETPVTTFTNRDVVAEVSFEAAVNQGREGGRGWASNLPRWIEPGTEMTLVMQQVFAKGTRPTPIAGGQRAMHFLKFPASIPAAVQLKTWQTLHARAVGEQPAFGDGLQGYEVLQRLPEIAARQTLKYAGDVPLPDLMVSYWSKDGMKNYPDYARAMRMTDKENAVDLPHSFFLIVQEFDAAFGG